MVDSKIQQLQRLVMESSSASAQGRDAPVASAIPTAVEAAAAVNDEAALDTPIQGHEALTANLVGALDEGDDSFASGMRQPGGVSSNIGSRELIWKTAEGTEKRLILPIEMIKEEAMEDPEHLVSSLERGDMPDEEWNKMVAAIHEMKSSVRMSSSARESGEHNVTVKFDESAMRISSGAYIGNNLGGAGESGGESPGSPTVAVESEMPDIETERIGDGRDSSRDVPPDPKLDSSQTAGAQQSKTGGLTKLATKKGQKRNLGKGSKKGKGQRRNLSELQQPKDSVKVDNTENAQTEQAGENNGNNNEGATAPGVEEPESEQIDADNMFDLIKARFFQKETQLNDAEQLKELERLQAEREQQAKEAVELKKQQEEEERQKLQYGPGGRYGSVPSIAAITRVLEEQERARRAKRKKEREERLAQLKAEKEAAGEELDEEEIKKIQEEEEEDIDYTVEMAEEETVPQGQRDNFEREQELKGKKMRQIIRSAGKLVKLMPESTLPKKLPDNLVYWNRCETRVESQKLITYSQIQSFQKAKIVQFEDKKSAEKVMTDFPLIDELEMWADKSQQEYANNHEKAIFEMRKYPQSMKDFVTEGYIKFERVRPYDCLFNSRFESGNLRQVFKVPQEMDFDWVPIDDDVPDYLPEELQEEKREKIKQDRQAYMKERQQKHQTEEKEDEAEMKMPHNQRKRTYGGAFEPEPAAEEDLKDDQDKSNADLDVVNSDVEKDDEKQGISADEDGTKKKRKGKKKKAYTKPACEYNLYLQDDTNADSALFQWYYFSVMNIRQDTMIRINICNLSKPNGLYSKGMKPFVYSTNKFKQQQLGWHRGGDNVAYFSNGHTARYSKKTLDAHWMSDGTAPVGKDNYKQLHSLSFDYRFDSDYDIVYFAHFQPYTYSDLINYLCTLKANESNNDKMRMDYICNALGGAPMYGLTITSNINSAYINAGKEIFKYQRFEYKGATVKPKKIKYLEPEKKSRTKAQQDMSDSLILSVSDKSSDQEDKKTDKAKGDTSPVINVEPLHYDGKAGENDSKRPLIMVEEVDKIVQDRSDASLSPQNAHNQTALSIMSDVAKEKDQSRSKSRGHTPSHSVMEKRRKKRKAKDDKQASATKELFETHMSGKRGAGFLINAPADPNEGKDEKPYKKYLFITSRVHPGESQASHIVHGIINFLLSDDPEAQEIRDKFVVKVIPMLNPDGVIHGNYRVSLLGVDLNRRWKKPSKFLHPTVYYAKQIIKYFNLKGKQPGSDSGGVILSCDIHGHSRNMDLFTYNCTDEVSMNNLVIRSVAVGIDKRVPIFNIETCKFALEKDKENTARVVLFKELGILSSFTLECTYYGSEFLKRQKQGHFLLTKEQQDYQAERYKIAYHRKDIQIDMTMCFYMGADVLRGINYASKKRPLLSYWFRQPPKNIIELIVPGGNQKDNDIDPALLELEKAWKHLGQIKQDKHLGIGDRFDERDLVKDRPPSEEKKGRKVDMLDVALQDKLKKQKKGKKKRKISSNEKDGLQILVEKDGAEKLPKDYANTDMVDILSPDLAKKRKKRRAPTKRLSQVKRVDASQKTGMSKHTGEERALAEAQKTDESDGDEASSAGGRKVPIILREPGGGDDEEFDSDEEHDIEDELRTSQLIFSSGRGFHLQQKLQNTQDQLSSDMTGQVMQRDSSSDEDNHDQMYLKSKDLESSGARLGRRPLGLASTETPSVKHSGKFTAPVTKMGESARTAKMIESARTSKRQLNLSVRIKEGKASFKAAVEAAEKMGQAKLPRIESQLEMNSADEDRIESRLISNQHGPSFSQEFYNSNRKLQDREQNATNQLKEVAELSMKLDEHVMSKIEQTKKNLIQQVSAEELDGEDFLRDDFAMDDEVQDQRSPRHEVESSHSTVEQEALIGETFRKNKLSIDPVVLPTSKLEKISKVQMKTLEREHSTQFISLKSPRRSNQGKKQSKTPGKFVFAPQNGVYNQTQLLQNPELAKQHGINFMVTQQSDTKICNQQHQMTVLKHQLSMKMQTDKKKSRRPNHFAQQRSNPVVPASFTTSKINFASPEDFRSQLFRQQLDSQHNTLSNQPSATFLQSKRSVASLLKKSSNEQSQTTIQTVLAPIEHSRLSINDYVNEQVSLLEQTKVKVAAKRKKRQNRPTIATEMLIKQNNQPISSGMGLADHSATLVLPNIQENKSPTANRKDTMALPDSYNSQQNNSSMLDLGSIAPPRMATDFVSAKPSTQEMLGNSSISQLDGQILTLPPLSPHAVHNPHVITSTKKYLEVKNGFDFANNMNDRQLEKLLDLKLTNSLREKERRKSRPQFVIKPLDQREFIKIQLQFTEGTPETLTSKKNKNQQNDMRRSFQARKGASTTRNQIKILDHRQPPAPMTQLNSIDLDYRRTQQSPGMLSPSPSKRSLSMGYHNVLKTQHSPRHFSEQKFSHPSALIAQGSSATPELAARANLKKAIRQREGKSVAVHSMVNQTIVSGNKLLVFKPI